MRRELAWVGLVLVLAAGWALWPRPPQHVSAFGVSTRMSEAEVRAQLGAPDERKRTVRDPADWTYRRLGLEMDFRLEGFGESQIRDLYTPEVDLDGQVKFKRGAPAAEIRRLLGTPEIDDLNWLRFHVGEDILDVHLDRIQQTAEAFHVFWRARPSAQP